MGHLPPAETEISQHILIRVIAWHSGLPRLQGFYKQIAKTLIRLPGSAGWSDVLAQVMIIRVFSDSHFGSFYSQNLVLDSQILGAMVVSDAYMNIQDLISFIYVWLYMLIHL